MTVRELIDKLEELDADDCPIVSEELVMSATFTEITEVKFVTYTDYLDEDLTRMRSDVVCLGN